MQLVRHVIVPQAVLPAIPLLLLRILSIMELVLLTVPVNQEFSKLELHCVSIVQATLHIWTPEQFKKHSRIAM